VLWLRGEQHPHALPAAAQRPPGRPPGAPPAVPSDDVGAIDHGHAVRLAPGAAAGVCPAVQPGERAEDGRPHGRVDGRRCEPVPVERQCADRTRARGDGDSVQKLWPGPPGPRTGGGGRFPPERSGSPLRLAAPTGSSALAPSHPQGDSGTAVDAVRSMEPPVAHVPTSVDVVRQERAAATLIHRYQNPSRSPPVRLIAGCGGGPWGALDCPHRTNVSGPRTTGVNP